MKKALKKFFSLLCVTLSVNVYEQFQITPFTLPPGNYGRTAPAIQGVGVGTFPFTIPTNARLHVSNFYCNQQNGLLNGFLFRTDGNENIINRWQMFTGPNAASLTEKGTIYTDPNSTNGGFIVPGNLNLATNHLNIQATQGDIIFRAVGNLLNNNPASAVLNDRMRITSVHFTEPNTAPTNLPYTRIAISSGQVPFFALPPNTFITNPLAMLHMGDLWVHNGGTHRSWMNYGTFITRQSDGAYFGVRQNEDPVFFNATDRTDCIIAFGDNPINVVGAEHRYDRLRIIFNSTFQNASTPGLSGHSNGLEVMRFSPVATAPGQSQVCYVGIGDFSINNPIHPFQDPVRKLEILSDKLVSNANGNPQLRLTNFQQDPGNVNTTGKFSEFHSLQFGDLAITTRDNTQVNTPNLILKERFVGINTNPPVIP